MSDRVSHIRGYQRLWRDVLRCQPPREDVACEIMNGKDLLK